MYARNPRRGGSLPQARSLMRVDTLAWRGAVAV